MEMKTTLIKGYFSVQDYEGNADEFLSENLKKLAKHKEFFTLTYNFSTGVEFRSITSTGEQLCVEPHEASKTFQCNFEFVAFHTKDIDRLDRYTKRVLDVFFRLLHEAIVQESYVKIADEVHSELSGKFRQISNIGPVYNKDHSLDGVNFNLIDVNDDDKELWDYRKE